VAIAARLSEGLERRAGRPTYGGGVLLLLALCFFGAATNTMAGWLYALSGTILGLLAIAAVAPRRALAGLQVQRGGIEPVAVGERLTLELTVANPSAHPKQLLQARDGVPVALGPPAQAAIERVPARGTYCWRYTLVPQQRGIYRWHAVQLRSAALLGLFWARRDWALPVRAIVHPPVFPLARCPLLDSLGQAAGSRIRRDRAYRTDPEGVFKGIRPYRRGDPVRLIHWRTSARYGELRVRELETPPQAREVTIGLDGTARWPASTFELAASAAASLYCYAHRWQFDVWLWLPETGLVRGKQRVLAALATAQPQALAEASWPQGPLIWLTPAATGTDGPTGSHWIRFVASEAEAPPPFHGPVVTPARSLQAALESR